MRIKAVFFIAIFVCLIAAALKMGAVAGKGAATSPVTSAPVAGRSTAFAVSGKVSSIASAANVGKHRETGSKPTLLDKPGNPPADRYPAGATRDVDAAPAMPGAIPAPTPSLSFDGLSNFDNIAAYNLVILPPDMIGDVGPSHFVQAVNALLRVFDKNGTPLTPPFPIASIFAPLGTACSTRNDGEPNVVYDPLADRWLISEYCNNFPPFRQMIAVSKTADPTGEYFLYEFVMPNIRLNDFAKFGVWPDGYYMSTEEFIGSDYAGMGMFAFDRTKMLAGDPSAGFVYFSRPSISTARFGNFLPSDLDGLRPPAAGAPNTFVSYSATEYGEAQDAIRLFDFHADFIHPLNSTFTERPESPLSVAAFDPTSPDGRQDIAQPAPGEFLDSNSDRLNYRAAYRNLGTSESLVLNQTVRVSSATPYRAGVRVYELRRTGAAYAVNVQSTIGDASSSRWVASAAADNQGNIATGYNVGADDKKPSIRYSGRLATDPANTFRDEASLVEGTGVQKAFGWRWGDYTSMNVDPVDDCTFWMQGEYFTLESEQFSDYTWLTRVGKFKFPGCTAPPRATITGSVTNAANGQPVEGATITTGVFSRRSSGTGSYGSLYLLPGSYTVTAAARGFRAQTVNLSVSDAQTLTQNFALEPVPVIENGTTLVSAESCGPNGAPDPGENVTLTIPFRNTGSLGAQNLTATLLTGGGVTNPGPAQNYGTLTPGGLSVTRPFTFTVSPSTICGAEITLTLHLTDGAADLGDVVITLPTGKAKIAFQENFDRAQQLPPRWTRSESHNNEFELPSERNWRASMKHSVSGPKAAFSPDLNQIGINEMDSPVFFITTPTARLTFQNWYELETTFLRNRLYDGSVLEIRIGSGVWQDIITAGGAFESGGYDGTIDACCSNPLAGHQGWSGRSGINQTSEFVTASVRLPAAAAGNLVQLRWRVGTDVGTFREGQYVDDVLVTDGFVCGCSPVR